LECRDIYTNYDELVRRGEIKCRNLSFERFGRYPTRIKCVGSNVFEGDGSKIKDGVLIFEGIFKKGGLFKKAVYFGFEVKDSDVRDCLGITVDGKKIEFVGPETRFSVFTGPEEDEISFFGGGRRKINAQKGNLPPRIEDLLKIKEPKRIPIETDQIREVKKLHETKDTLKKRPSPETEEKIKECIEKYERLKSREAEIMKMLSEIKGEIEGEKKKIVEEIYRLNEDNKDVTYQIGDRLVQIRTIVKETPVGLSPETILNYLAQVEGVAEIVDRVKSVVVSIKETIGKEVIIEEKPKEGGGVEKTAQVSIEFDVSLDLLLEILKDLMKELNTKLHALRDFTNDLLSEVESVRVPELPMGELELSPTFASYENRGDMLPIRRVAKKKEEVGLVESILEKWNKYELNTEDVERIVE